MTTPQGLAVSAAHDAAQARLLDTGLAQLTLAFTTLLDPRDLDGSSRVYVPTATEIVRANRANASAVSATFYNALRDVETAGMPNVPAYAAAVAEEPAEALLRTSMTVTGPVSVKSNLARGMVIDLALEKALSSTLGAATRHIEGGPRDVTRLNSYRDPSSNGWARRSGGTPCSFCAMLISRGPVYSEGTGNFRSHDHCHCKAVAFFGADNGWTMQSREMADLWKASDGTLKGFDRVYRQRHPRTISPRDTRDDAYRSQRARKAAETRKANRATPAPAPAPVAPVAPSRPATVPSVMDVPEPAAIVQMRESYSRNRDLWKQALLRKKRGAKTQVERYSAYLDNDHLNRHAPKTDLLEDLPKYPKDLGLSPDDYVQLTNPLYATDPRAGINCVHVANTYELQRRGYAVTATPLPRSMGSAGRDAQESLLRWRDENGDGRLFSNAYSSTLTSTLASEWPEGARGFVTVQWRRGGGHIFNAEKVGGQIRYYEAQSRDRIDFDTDYGRKAHYQTGSVKYARVDDLTPSNDVLEFVQEGSDAWASMQKAKKAADKARLAAS